MASFIESATAEKSWEWKKLCDVSAEQLKGSFSTYEVPCGCEGGIWANMETLVIVNHIRPQKIYPEEAQRGAWIVCMCVCVWGHVVFVCSFETEVSVPLVFWEMTFRALCVASGDVWILVFARYHWREELFNGHLQPYFVEIISTLQPSQTICLSISTFPTSHKQARMFISQQDQPL